MSEPQVIPWVRLLTLMVDGPDPEPTVRGAISCRDGDEQRSWSLGWDQPGQRWRDDRWEWAVRLYDEELSESGLAELKRQLGSG